jgi:hypothetical protein
MLREAFVGDEHVLFNVNLWVTHTRTQHLCSRIVTTATGSVGTTLRRREVG